MRLLCFQAKRFRWKTHSKILRESPDQEIDRDIEHTLVVFVEVEASDTRDGRSTAVLRAALKHIKWLANKRALKNIVLHSFAHLGGDCAPPASAETIIQAAATRLRATGYAVWSTPFGYSCEWDLSVHGESLAKVWKEIR